MKSKNFSLRQRLVIGIVGAIFVILGSVAYATYWSLEHETDEIFKARLASSARLLAALISDHVDIDSHQGPTPILLDTPFNKKTKKLVSYGHKYERKIAFQVWSDERFLIAKSENASLTPISSFAEGYSNQKIDGEDWEVFALNSGGLWVFAAEHLDVLDEKTHKLALAVLTPFFLGTVFLLLAVNFLVHLNLAPLRNLAYKISSRNPEALATIDLESTPLEIKPVLDELNALIQRVNEAFKREQWFIDAAAHELRTPIAALQIHVQNALYAETESARTESLHLAIEGLRRTTRLAEQLLAYSRIASANDDQPITYLQLDFVCRDVARSFENIFRSKSQVLKIDVEGDCVIKAELGKIERLIQNLLDNASKYGSSPGVIQLSVRALADQVELSVSNTGITIPNQEKLRILEPYYRIRGQSASGTGLGLAIVHQIAQQFRASVLVKDMENSEGTIFIVRFPLSS